MQGPSYAGAYPVVFFRSNGFLGGMSWRMVMRKMEPGIVNWECVQKGVFDCLFVPDGETRD